jgi:hypothetical protein
MQVGQRAFFSGRALKARTEKFDRQFILQEEPHRGCNIPFDMELTAIRQAQ